MKKLKNTALCFVLTGMLVISGCELVLNKTETDVGKAEVEVNEQTNVVNEVNEQTNITEYEVPARPKAKKEPVDIFIKNVDIDLNIRSLPKHKSDLVCKVQNYYTTMYYYGESADGLGSDGIMHSWYKVYVNNEIEGWARSDLVISQSKLPRTKTVEEIENIVVAYFNENFASDGTYVIFSGETVDNGTNYQMNVRFQGNNATAANVLYAIVKVEKSSGGMFINDSFSCNLW